MQNENKLGHNKPPKFKELPVEISSLKNNQGRITLKNSIIKILKRFEYVEPNKDGTIKFADGLYYDTEKVGLQLKVNRHGVSKSFQFQMWDRVKKRPKKYHLGSWPEMKVEAARSLIDKIKHGVKSGHDPKVIIEQQKLIPTLKEVVREFLRTRLDNERRRESTQDDMKNRLGNWIFLKAKNPILAAFLNNNRKELNIGMLQVNKITAATILKWYKLVGKRGKPLANRIVDDLKTIINWAMKRKEWKIETNFFELDADDMFHIPARIDMHNPYSIDDAARIEKHIKDKLYLDKKLNKFSKQFVALLGLYISLFQGRRYKDEILKMKWSGGTSDVRLALKEKLVWLPKMKNEDKPTYYPLNSKSLWAIMQLKKYCNYKFKRTNQIRFKRYVFPSPKSSKKQHIYRIDKTWYQIVRELGLRKLPPYMLRHTWASIGVEATDIKQVKDEGGWKTWKMVERYAQRSETARRKTTETIANKIATVE